MSTEDMIKTPREKQNKTKKKPSKNKVSYKKKLLSKTKLTQEK